MTLRLLIALATVVALYFPTFAQVAPSFTFPNLNGVAEGSIISVPVTVTNLKGIASLGMAFRWDPTVLQYIGTTSHNLQDLDPADFGTVNAQDSGLLRLVWWRFVDTIGITVPDGAVLFRIRFRVVGEMNSFTPLVFTDLRPDLVFEVGLANGNRFLLNELIANDGFVAVGYTVNIENLELDSRRILAYPNPRESGQDLTLVLPESFENQNVIIAAIDRMGRKTTLSFANDSVNTQLNGTKSIFLAGEQIQSADYIAVYTKEKTYCVRLVQHTR